MARLRILALVCGRLCRSGHRTVAARLFGYVNPLSRVADRFNGPWPDILDRVAEDLRQLPDDERSALIEEGERMTTEEAMSYLSRWDLPLPERRATDRLAPAAAAS